MHRWMIRVALLLAPLPVSAQTTAGTWDVTWAQAVRIDRDGSMVVQKWGKAVLDLTQEGERVVGSWTTEVAGRVRWTVEGTCAGGRLELVAREHDSSDPELARVAEMRWRGVVEGNRLEGEMTLLFAGAARDRPWRPWSATRREELERPSATGPGGAALPNPAPRR